MRLAARFRELRVLKDLKRETLALMSGVPSASIRRFELLGEVSLRSLVMLAHALGVADQLDEIFRKPTAESLAELELRERHLSGSQRKRGRK